MCRVFKKRYAELLLSPLGTTDELLNFFVSEADIRAAAESGQLLAGPPNAEVDTGRTADARRGGDSTDGICAGPRTDIEIEFDVMRDALRPFRPAARAARETTERAQRRLPEFSLSEEYVATLRAQYNMEEEARYEEARGYWRDLVEDVARRAGQDGEWQPWLPRTYWDGTPLPRSLNTVPTWDARSETMSRAIRSIQIPPWGDEIGIRAWLTKFDYTKPGGPGPTEELVFSLALSEQSAAIARALLKHWVNERVSYRQMEALIRDSLHPASQGR